MAEGRREPERTAEPEAGDRSAGPPSGADAPHTPSPAQDAGSGRLWSIMSTPAGHSSWIWALPVDPPKHPRISQSQRKPDSTTVPSPRDLAPKLLGAGTLPRPIWSKTGGAGPPHLRSQMNPGGSPRHLREQPPDTELEEAR